MARTALNVSDSMVTGIVSGKLLGELNISAYNDKQNVGSEGTEIELQNHYKILPEKEEFFSSQTTCRSNGTAQNEKRRTYNEN